MHDTQRHTAAALREEKLRHADIRLPPKPSTMPPAVTKRHLPSNFEAALLSIAAHDLRQPLQALQSTHDLLKLTARTPPEQELLQTGQNAIDRLKEQIQQLQTALRIRETTLGVNLRLLPVNQLFWRALQD